MLCSRVRKSLHRYVAGDTEKIEDLLINEHLNNCYTCKLEYERIIEIKSILSNLGRNIEAPSGLITSIMDSIDLQKYKSIGLYAINNLRSLGISFIAAGIIIALFNLFPMMEQYFDSNIVDKSMAQIQSNIINPLEMVNNSIIDISERIFDLSKIIDADSEQ
ncbi:anti-sigma factor family protein [Lutispora sp.]|uniref:anti-sigma factor family protein n=1 Tax=Lutispora sp. TaxID=2828727 RepID=UPI0035635E9C